MSSSVLQIAWLYARTQDIYAVIFLSEFGRNHAHVSVLQSISWCDLSGKTDRWCRLGFLLSLLLFEAPLRDGSLSHSLVNSSEHVLKYEKFHLKNIWRSLQDGIPLPSWGNMEDTHICPCWEWLSHHAQTLRLLGLLLMEQRIFAGFMSRTLGHIHDLILLYTSSLADIRKLLWIGRMVCCPVHRESCSSLWTAS